MSASATALATAPSMDLGGGGPAAVLRLGGRRLPWYTMACACMLGQGSCWLNLIIFYANNHTNQEVCKMYNCEERQRAEECGCRLGIPFFSYTAIFHAEHMTFGVGLTLTMLLGLLGVETINRMYHSFCRQNGILPEPNRFWCCLCCCCCCCDSRRRPVHADLATLQYQGPPCTGCTIRPYIPYLLRALRPLSVSALLCLPVLAWVNLQMNFGIHILAAFMFFMCLCGYHVLLTLLQWELLRQLPLQCEETLNLTSTSWRFRVKWAWIVCLFCIFIMNEVTRFGPNTLWVWESITGPLAQWTAILGTIIVSGVHSNDLYFWYKSLDAAESPPLEEGFADLGNLDDTSSPPKMQETRS